MQNSGQNTVQNTGQTSGQNTGYSGSQIALHWLIAALLVLQLLFGEAMTDVWRGWRNTGTATMTTMAWAHIIGGCLVLALVVWRIALRLRRGVPEAPEGEAPALKMLAGLTHLTLYGLMLVLPVSGLVAWYGGVTTAGEVHEVLKSVLWIVMGLHVAGALYHQFILRNGLIGRMMRPAD